ncbi:MAG: hypothetical protein M4579_001295 [Chaenotheca gracillima]|nr:MAG: hypothetical protein M4579_001295 [Chaenotheca gracillima]
MASQDNSGLAFTFAQKQQGFRLLELPPAILDIINSENPPILSLKSTATASANSHAVLCTPDRTFQLRQVHSSNSIFLIEPSAPGISLEDNAASGSTIQVTGSSKETLELIPTSPPTRFLLRSQLNVYHGPQEADDDFETMPSVSKTAQRSRMDIFANIPASANEIAQAWRELCAFESSDQSWLPSTSALSRIWRDLTECAALKGVQLGSNFHATDLWPLLEDCGYPHGFYEAILSRLDPNDHPSPHENRVIDRKKCVPWVGAVLLESCTENGDTTTKDFLKTWADQVPEEWRGDVSLDLIKGKYSQPTTSTIAFDHAAVKEEESKGSANAQAKGAPRSRKWHEKFRPASKK